MKKEYKKAGLVLFLLIFLILVLFSRTKVLKSINIWTKIFPPKKAAVSFYALTRNFRGKLNLACGKIGNDNKIIVVPQNSSPAIIKVFDRNGQELWTSGVHSKYQSFNVVLGDLDGDSKNEIVLGQEKEKSFIYIYKQKKKKFVFSRSFEAFKNLPIGVNLALGDVNGDKKSEIIVGAGQGGGPQIKIFDGKGQELGNFFAFHPKMRHGVRIATLDFDGDDKDEIVALSNLERDTQFKIYKFDKIYSLQNLKRVYGKKTKLLTKIVTADLDGDGKLEIITIPEKKVGKSIAIFKGSKKLPSDILGDFLDSGGGFNIVFCNLDGNKKDDVVVNEKNSLIKVFYR